MVYAYDCLSSLIDNFNKYGSIAEKINPLFPMSSVDFVQEATLNIC